MAGGGRQVHVGRKNEAHLRNWKDSRVGEHRACEVRPSIVSMEAPYGKGFILAWYIMAP